MGSMHWRSEKPGCQKPGRMVWENAMGEGGRVNVLGMLPGFLNNLEQVPLKDV